MKPLPESLLMTLTDLPGFDREAFERIHAQGQQVTSIRINPFKTASAAIAVDRAVPWSRFGFYLKTRPSFTFDPLFHAGCYYVQEASSMFLEQAFQQLADTSVVLKVLDLCAAPGGKSTHIQSLISPESLLISNDVIRSRSNVLTDNIIKWGGMNTIVTNNDPVAFQKLPGYFDIMVVDAPCSGSGLFRRDEDAMDEWSLNHVQLCCQRQRRILADALPCLKEGGLLVYSTCSYSKEEDEHIADWLVEECGMRNEPLQIEPHWKIVESAAEKTGSVGYRFYPDRLEGEGFYMACFTKSVPAACAKFRGIKIEKATAKIKNLAEHYLKHSNSEILQKETSCFALPASMIHDYAQVQSALHVRYAGVELGQVMKDKLVPSHALALSTDISDDIPAVELNYDNAIRYLQRQDLHYDTSEKGWTLVRYQNHNLGWINVLPNRVNNYYPKELRILKQSQGPV